MITLNNIVKEYYDSKNKNATKAVNGINLQINQGEFVSLLGPSGCGKTTTLMMIAGLLKPTEGEIIFDGKIVNHIEPKDRNIGMVFQSYALYPHLKVIDNIAFPLREKKIPKKESYKKAQRIAEKLQIGHLMDRMPTQLSGGQQQRVAMARALVKEPQILLLDEPMSNLDARLKLDLRDEIRKIQKEIGVTTVLVTHDQEEALAMSDRVAVLDGGEIQQYDAPYQLYNKPKNLFIANFLGNPPMNIMEGTVVQEEKQQQIFQAPGIRLVLPETRRIEEKHLGNKMVLGVRPHDISIVPKSNDHTIELKIDLIEHLGSEQLLKVNFSQGDSKIRLITEAEQNYQVGQIIHAKINEMNFNLFSIDREGVNVTL